MFHSSGTRRSWQKDKTVLPRLLACTAPGSATQTLPPDFPFGAETQNVLSALVLLEALLAARLPWQAPLCPGPDPGLSCLGTQQRERLGYFKQVMSVLPSLPLPILPEALITVAGWICWTKRANGLIDMIWQLICNLIIMSSRTHYSLFITLLSSQICLLFLCFEDNRTHLSVREISVGAGAQERLPQWQTKLLSVGCRHLCL